MPVRAVRARLAALAALMCILWPVVAVAQLAIPLPQASASNTFGVPIKRIGALDTTPILFRGVRLFTIAAPGADTPTATPPIVVRAEIISGNLEQIAPADVFALVPGQPRFDPATFRVEEGSENGYPTIYATDGHAVIPILTVTDADAKYNGMDRGALAKQWRGLLFDVLQPTIQASTPEYRMHEAQKLAVYLIVAFVATFGLTRLRRFCRRREGLIDAQVADTAVADAGRLHARRTLYSAGEWLSSVGIVALWILLILFLLNQFPATRLFAHDLRSKLGQVTIALLVVIVFDRVAALVIASAANAWQANPFAAPEVRERQRQRNPTFISAVQNVRTIVAYVVAVGWTASILSINTTSALTISAVVAFAVSFAVQSIIKDYVNGLLILAEDQFAIGDYVTINAIAGVVENLTLRITQIRSDDGRLVTMPNSTIATVENASRIWGRIDFRIAIANDSDVALARTALQATLDALAAEPQNAASILEPPQVLGVESVSNGGTVLRAWIKVAAKDRAALAREVNQQATEAFRAAGIALAVPQTMMVPTATPVAPQ